jgi:nucleoside-diphosphate-sugar epimerase
MTNLVTGATGLVGMHIVLDLLKKNEIVKATHTKNSSFETIEKLFEFYNQKSLLKKIYWVEMDLEDVSQVYQHIRDVDHVYHCAAIVSFSKKQRVKMHNINVKGTSNIVNACLDNKVKKLGFISSVAAIGRKGNSSYTEKNSWVNGSDNSYYAISKFKAENEVWRGIQEGLNAVITNPGIIIGPSIWNRSSTSLFKKIHSGVSHFPSGSNGFVDVRDVSRSIIELTKSTCNAERYIVVGENISYQKVFKLIAENLKVKVPQKLASQELLKFACKLEAVKCFFTGKNPQLTKETVKTSSQKNEYLNDKIKKALNFEFKSIEEAVNNTAKYILKFK